MDKIANIVWAIICSIIFVIDMILLILGRLPFIGKYFLWMLIHMSMIEMMLYDNIKRGGSR
nr:MAG TPA: hypothetical protein [Caudoviricetes sp.]